ncbi:MAG: ABC transporter ATP-binding protein [Spirochaetaceae bacterium]|jgi:oligopeptide/dipeptide ABC transporter ATP-binding protein|nr:ABC transporter ATP-binding protein [Spirochaetaceae bacterium]
MGEQNLITIKDLQVNLMSPYGVVHAVRNINFDIAPGEIHALVGESGCGKSMTAKAILRLHDEKKMLYGGHIFFDGKDLLALKVREIRELRGSEIAMIFQDPVTALNPLLRVGEQIGEMLIRRGTPRAEARRRVLGLLEDVGIQPPEERYRQYPFEMSGGMLQRVMIAMALSHKPKLLIADEPTTALDMTVQAQILDLLLKLQKKNGMAILIITHNFGVVAEICRRVSVMYAGIIVESGDVREIFHHPKHPYTRDLIFSIPQPRAAHRKLVTIPGMPPDLREKIAGCPYAPRCAEAAARCRELAPEMREAGDSHSFSCHNEIREQ